MNLNKYKHIVFSLAAGGLLLVGLFLLLNEMPQMARAAPSDLFVTLGGGGDCSQGNPCDLQTALNQAVDGDILYLAQGSYTGAGGAVITVTRSITIYGGWDGATTTPVVRNPDTYLTTLNGEDTRRAVDISGNISPTIDGFVITGGKAPDGGGVYIHDASPIIQNNIITANRTIDSGTYTDGRGGGIFVGGTSNAVIAQNHILSNTSGYGGGIYHDGATAITITANEIVDNVASERGGGILLENSPDIVRVNLISGNTAAGDGGGMLIWAAAPLVEANRITGNSANSGGGISMGNNATPSLLNNLLIGNAQDGVFVGSSSPVIVNNTIVGSGLVNSRDGIRLWSSPGCAPPYCIGGSIINNIIVSYEVGIFGSGVITPVIDYNDVWGNTTADYSLPVGVGTGTHNISLDPLFINPVADDYHLQSGSPCVNAGDPAGVPPAPPTDIDGYPRPTGSRVDIGADEVQLNIFLPVVLRHYAPQHRIGVRQVNGSAEFFDRQTGERFVPRGVNYVFVPQNGAYTNLLLKVGIYDPQRTRHDFGTLVSNGYNTVRVFLDQCNAGPGCIGDSDNVGLNPAYLDNITDMLTAAKQTGIHILFTSNDLPDQGGYAEQANAQSGPIFAGYRNSYYLTPGAVEATRRYWRDLLTGLNARSAATDMVLGWQLLNEQWMFIDQPPLSLMSGMVETTTGVYDMSDPGQKQRMVSDGLIYYISEVKAEILKHDPTALVTMGFFAPEIVAPGWYVETASLLAGADLDFFDFHAYPGSQSLAELAKAFGMNDYNAKPIILGEYGAFRHIYPALPPAARAITNWQAESCTYGFDGWLYWTYYPANENVGDSTWGLVDESGFLLELLAPATHPDPCVAVEVPSDNLAYQKPVRASASLLAEPPTNAVDENAASQWGAGAHAPQWIEIDLGQAYRLTEIRLLVAQWPEGDTVHRIRGRSASGAFLELHTFRQRTRGGDWLIFAPATPVDGIQIIRVDTLSSPSWVAWGEIQVYGEATP